MADSSQAWQQLEAEMALTPAGEVPERLIVEGVLASATTLDNPPGMTQIRLVEDRADRVVVEVTAEESGWLFIADSWYPGWQASVDQKQTPLYRADYLFRAIWLPAGRHEVVFAYRPASFRAGLGLSLADGLSVLLWLNRRKSWKRTAQAPEQQG
ncbi:MAG: YfhO family protein [Chloroflexi bacterium]|nr:YfhO family protein [Chloroflexota bacterium]